MKLGVLALQGGFRPHAEAFRALDATVVEVRCPADLAPVDAVVIPGGESTTLSHLLRTSDLLEPLRERLGHGLPALGTCAGMIVLAAGVDGGRPDQVTLGAIDLSVRRNAHGRQRDSFEAPLEGFPGGAFPGVFIRAPGITRIGPDVEVWATLSDNPVAAREGRVVVSAFHPELAGDLRFHQRFLSEVCT